MKKYYTRACNFYYGFNARLLIKKKLALPLCGNPNIAFDRIELITRQNNRVHTKTINFKIFVSLKKGCNTNICYEPNKMNSVAYWLFF